MTRMLQRLLCHYKWNSQYKYYIIFLIKIQPEKGHKREKLEKIPLAKELKAPSGEKAETVKYAEHERLERNVKHKRIEQRRPIRIYHTANWKKRIDGILSGKVNPFLISIVASGKKRTKEKPKQDKEKEFVQNMLK